MADITHHNANGRVAEFLNGLPNNQIKTDCYILKKILSDVTGCEPKMWSKNIIGFGSYRYRYESGREGETCLIGLSPKKQNLTLYLAPHFDEDQTWQQRLGKAKIGKGCLYIKRIEDVDIKSLKLLISHSIKLIQQRHGNISL